jgi:pyruvate kinase
MGGKGKVVNGGRIRKVTITEIDNDQEWNWPNPGNLDDEVETQIYEDVIEKTTDEVFAALEDVVTDWKIKLEVVVGEGLKKIKRTSREKKAMMKYLPGDGVSTGGAVLTKAKKEILNDWKTEVAKTVKETHNKLNELGSAKVQDAVVVSEGILKVEVKSEMKKEKAGKQVTKGAYLDLKKLMRELDTLYQNYAADKMNYNKVRIISITNHY